MTAVPPEDRLLQERQLLAAGCRRLAGVDEAGRGPLAGPVVAAGHVIVNSGYDKFGEIGGNVLLVFAPRPGAGR